jgi:hypothetical protein
MTGATAAEAIDLEPAPHPVRRPLKARVLPLRACARCGREYRPKRPWGRFCTRKCRVAQHAEDQAFIHPDVGGPQATMF